MRSPWEVKKVKNDVHVLHGIIFGGTITEPNVRAEVERQVRHLAGHRYVRILSLSQSSLFIAPFIVADSSLQIRNSHLYFQAAIEERARFKIIPLSVDIQW